MFTLCLFVVIEGKRSSNEQVDDDALVLDKISPFKCLDIPVGANINPKAAVSYCNSTDDDMEYFSFGDEPSQDQREIIPPVLPIESKSAIKHSDPRVGEMLEALSIERRMSSELKTVKKNKKRNNYPSSRKKPSLVMGSPPIKQPRKKKKMCKQGRRSKQQYEAYLRRMMGDEEASNTLKHHINKQDAVIGSESYVTPRRKTDGLFESSDEDTPPVIKHPVPGVKKNIQSEKLAAPVFFDSTDSETTPDTIMRPSSIPQLPSSPEAPAKEVKVKKQFKVYLCLIVSFQICSPLCYNQSIFNHQCVRLSIL